MLPASLSLSYASIQHIIYVIPFGTTRLVPLFPLFPHASISSNKNLCIILLPSFATLLLCNAPHYPSSRHHTLHEFPEGLHTTRHAHASREQRLLTCLTHIVSTASANPACLLSSEAPSRTCKAVNQLSTASTPKLIRQPLTTLAIAPFSRR